MKTRHHHRAHEQSLLERFGSTGIDRRLHGSIGPADAVLFSDYNKGVLTERVVAETLNLAEAAGRPTLANPKPANFRLFQGLDLVSVNQSEAEAVTGLSLGNEAGLLEAGRRLLDQCGSRAALVTQGGHGLSLFVRDGTCAGLLVVASRSGEGTGAEDGITVLLVDARAPGVTISPLVSSARDRQAEITFAGVRMSTNMAAASRSAMSPRQRACQWTSSRPWPNGSPARAWR